MLCILIASPQAVEESLGLKDSYIGKVSPLSFALVVRTNAEVGSSGSLLWCHPLYQEFPSDLRASKYTTSNPGSYVSIRLTLHSRPQLWRPSSASLFRCSNPQSTGVVAGTAWRNRENLALLVHSVPDLTTVDTASTLLQLLAVDRNIWLTAGSDSTNSDGVMSAFIEDLAALLN